MFKRRLLTFLVSIFGIFVINSTSALTYSLPEEGNIIGAIKKIKMNKGDTLFKIAKKYDIGVQEILSHNKGMSLNKVQKPGTMVTVPQRFVLPSVPHEGIVINLAKMRLFYFHPDSKKVSTYPVGIGRKGWSTPKGTTTVTSKQKNPSWRPPLSIRLEALRRGKHLALVIPAGPRNPLGQYAISLGMKGILIHGTPQQGSIGTKCSHGCLRMYSHNIEDLFNNTVVGTPVCIISE